jgi:hypothetical protein
MAAIRGGFFGVIGSIASRVNRVESKLVSRAEVAELADATDSKSVEVHSSCGFDPHLRHQPHLSQLTVRF